MPFIIVAAVALITLASAAALYWAYKPQVLTISREQAEEGKGDSAHARGASDAVVTIEEFGDFQCPPCGLLSEPLNQLEKDYHGRVRLVFREYPLVTHAHAKEAALAAEAAGLQRRFWEMHDLLYREQLAWGKASTVAELFAAYAKMVGLESSRFQKDVQGEEAQARLAADQKRAAELGVSVTPTIFVNGKSLPGPSLNAGGLRAAVEAALTEKAGH